MDHGGLHKSAAAICPYCARIYFEPRFTRAEEGGRGGGAIIRIIRCRLGRRYIRMIMKRCEILIVRLATGADAECREVVRSILKSLGEQESAS